MAKKKNSKKQTSEKNYEAQHRRNLDAYQRQIDDIYRDAVSEAASISSLVGNFDREKPFVFADYPITRHRIGKLLESLKNGLSVAIVNGIRSEWTLANNKNNELCRQVFGDNIGLLTESQYNRYFSTNPKALEAFIERRTNGLSLSDRVWNYTNQFKKEIEAGIDLGLRDGLPATEMARDLKQYLKHPDKLFRRVRDEHGQLQLSKNAKAFHPGQGVYRSSYRNARRLAATECNIAYRTADHERCKNLDFVVGIHVILSNNHTLNGEPFRDICDELSGTGPDDTRGRYPKDFKFTGWHPLCYSDDTSVLTDKGWRLFKDVEWEDMILSLNPETRQTEWVCIADMQAWHHTGKMVHFHNRSLDCLVTPEHRMVYLNKTDGRIKYAEAESYRKGLGGFYRGALYDAVDRESININGLELDFDWFCEFMGYWLSDGSTIRSSQIVIAQQDGESSKPVIASCLGEQFKVTASRDKLNIYCAPLCSYLKQFGVCDEKYIPSEIMTASPRQIRISLDTFSHYDDHRRTPHSLVGNHGHMCSPKHDEVTYYTTSERLAGNLCELILKAGARPSVAVSEPHTAVKKDGTVICSNYPCYVIRECASVTTTVFEKEFIDYDAMVYDVTLEKNHIMYVARNGKCFWGSNCRCHVLSIIKSDEELDEDSRRRWNDEEPLEGSVNEVKDVPEEFKKWLEDNDERIQRAKSLPYFMKDNPDYCPSAKEALKRHGVEGKAKAVVGSVVADTAAGKEAKPDYGDIAGKLGLATAPREKKAFVSFEPFSPAIMDHLDKIKVRAERNRLFESILNDERAEVFFENDKAKTAIFPGNKGKGKVWEQTKQMAVSLNKKGRSVCFLPELKGGSVSADAIIQFKGKWVIADFKHSNSFKSNTIMMDIHHGFVQANTLVVQMARGDAGTFRDAVEEIIRKKEWIGNIVLLNEYGKVCELDYKTLRSGKYKKLIQGFL